MGIINIKIRKGKFETLILKGKVVIDNVFECGCVSVY